MSTIFDRNLLPEFESVKDEDENFIWLGKPELKTFLANMLVTGIIGVVLITAVVMFNLRVMKENENSNSFFVYFMLAIIFIPLIFRYFAAILSYKNTIYGFSNKRIMMRSGFVGTDFKMIDYDKIIDIEVKVNPIARFFNTGTIKFFSGREKLDDEGSSTKLYDEWKYIENVYEVFKQVKKVMVDIKTDYNYPNAKRPPTNPGYNTKYEPE